MIMDKFIAKVLKEYEDGKVDRRQLIQTIKVAAATFAAGEEAANAAANGSKSFKTINVNHISYTCPDYTIARDFYQHLMGMGVVSDSGRQCYMPFGPVLGKGPDTFLLPRSNRTPPESYKASGVVTAPPAPRRGGAGAAGATSGTPARGGRGAGAAPAARPERPVDNVTIDHIAYTVKNWDKARVKAILESWGLFPTEDSDSFHVRDPFGYNLQISGPGMFPYEEPRAATTTPAGGKQ